MSIWKPSNRSKVARITKALNGETVTKKNRFKFLELDKNWVITLDKIINENGCWIPKLKPHHLGYVDITIENNVYQLHRLVICIYENLHYHDLFWDSRHNNKCSRACFNPEHLKSGTKSENMQDKIRDGNNHEINKKSCPKCGGEYRKHTNKSGLNKGKTYRFCPICQVSK